MSLYPKKMRKLSKPAYRIAILICVFLVFQTPAYAAVVRTGAQVLADAGFAELAGKRVGLVTNHTAMVDGKHLIDLIASCGTVKLSALFAPEHGLRGLQEDGVSITEGRDERTGVRIYSLYGRTRKPTAEMLRDVDLLLFDIQGVGARFYTFISTMGLAMQAAAEARIPFVILDRPNPLGGKYVSGPLVEPGRSSFVGLYPIPVAHGMTMGELALMIKGEKMLPGLENLDIMVVRMEGWRRSMLWTDTGLKWVRTSPNIPDFTTALLYPGICFIEATSVSEGRGTAEPFKVVGAPGLDAAALAATLNGKRLPGVVFEPVRYVPKEIPGMSSRPKYKNRTVDGIRMTLTDLRAYRPVETGIHLLSVLYASVGNKEREVFFRKNGFDKLAGSKETRVALTRKVPPESIISSWNDGLNRFGAQRRKYLLYPD